jgi:hypothetical protein
MPNGEYGAFGKNASNDARMIPNQGQFRDLLSNDCVEENGQSRGNTETGKQQSLYYQTLAKQDQWIQTLATFSSASV